METRCGAISLVPQLPGDLKNGPGVREITEAGKKYWSMMVFMGFHGKLVRLTYYDYYDYYYSMIYIEYIIYTGYHYYYIIYTLYIYRLGFLVDIS